MVKWTVRPAMTIAVDMECKATKQIKISRSKMLGYGGKIIYW